MPHTRWIWGHSATIIKPAAQGAAVPIAISFSPSAPTIFDNAALATFVSAVSVTMSDGSTFTGVLGFTLPNNDDGGKFVLSGANVVTNAAMPTGASTQSVTVFASQNGTAVTASLNVSVQAHGTGTVLTTFQLSSAQTGVAPFTVGVALRKGQSIGPLSTNVVSSQVVIMRRWSDNTVKHCIISGIGAFSQPNTPVTVQVLDQAGSGGASLTAANIATAAPTATVDFGGGVTVNLASLLASPVRTFVSGTQMVECHYSATASNGVLVFFHVRLYSNNIIWVRATADNGWADIANADKSYVATVTIGGVVVFTGSITHFANTRWVAEGFIGGNPVVTPKHNMVDLLATKLVPNYYMDTPSAAALNALYQNYVPYDTSRLVGGVQGSGSSGDWSQTQGATGFQNDIGLLPLWDALHVTSLGDSRSYAAVVANTKAIGNFAIVWRGSTDNNLPCRPSIYPSLNVPGGGSDSTVAGPLTWERNHHGSAGYLAYLLTGDYLALEAMQLQCATEYLCSSAGNGLGTNRIVFAQTRGAAWALRTFSQLAAIGPPNDPVIIDYRAITASAANHWASVITSTPGINNLGIIYEEDSFDANTLGPTGEIGMFMHHFWVQANGMGSDIEPLADMTNWNVMRDWMYKIPSGQNGTASGTDFCYSEATSLFHLVICPPNSTNITQMWANWGIAYTQNFGAAPCGNTLGAGSPSNITPENSNPTTGTIGNFLPAVAYSVDHGAPGAAAGYNRMTGATNWLAVRNATNSSFADVPMWGIQPRVSTTDAASALLATMAAGSWKAAGTNTLSAVAYGSNAGDDATLAASIRQNSGPAAIMSAWGGATFDPVNSRLILCNGGHQDYWGNEVYAFNLKTLSWANLSKPTDPSLVDSSRLIASDGTPAAPHNYNGLVWDPSKNKVLFLGSGVWFPLSGETNIAWYMDPSTMVRGTTAGTGGTSSWTRINDDLFQNGQGSSNSQAVFDTTSGHIWAWQWQSFGLFEYNPTTGIWSTHGSSAPGSTITAGNQTSSCQPGVKLVSTGGGWTYWWDFTGVLHIQTTTGDKTAENAAGPGFQWHPPTGKFIAWTGGTTIYTLDPNTWVWTAVAMTAAGTDIPTATQPNGTFGRFRYDAAHNCVIAVNDITQTVFMGKLPF